MALKVKVTQLGYAGLSNSNNRRYRSQPQSPLPVSVSLILSGTSGSPGVRHFSSLASFHTHIRASSLSQCLAPCLTLSLRKRCSGRVLRDRRIQPWPVRSRWGRCPAKGCTFGSPERTGVSRGWIPPGPPASGCVQGRTAARSA